MGQNAPLRYIVDSKVSQFTVQAFASGLMSAVAHSPKIAIRDWKAEVDVVPGAVQNSILHVRIQAASLQVLDELRDRDRVELHRVMNQEVLETSRFPEIRYESSGITADKRAENLYQLQITGKLSLHGVTKTHNFSAQLAFGVESFRAYGEFIVLQPDYDIHVASIAGSTLRLRDDVKCYFYVVAREQPMSKTAGA